MNEKKKLDINSVLLTTLILFVICALMALALAGTDYITKEKIKALEEKTYKDSLSVVLKAETYTTEKLQYTDLKGNQTVEYVTALNGEEKLGYIFTTVANGYGGEITVMTGVSIDGSITNVKILSADDETPGLGRNITKSDFYKQYSGKRTGVEVVKNNAFANNQVVAVTSATISSTAVNNAVQKALDYFEFLTAENVQEPASDESTENGAGNEEASDEAEKQEKGEEVNE